MDRNGVIIQKVKNYRSKTINLKDSFSSVSDDEELTQK